MGIIEFCFQKFLTRNAEQLAAIERRIERLEKIVSTQQSAIDALTAQQVQTNAALTATQQDVQEMVTGITSLQSTITTIQAELTALQNQPPNQPLDLTALTAAVTAGVTEAATVKSNADAAVAELPAVAPAATTTPAPTA